MYGPSGLLGYGLWPLRSSRMLSGRSQRGCSYHDWCLHLGCLRGWRRCACAFEQDDQWDDHQVLLNRTIQIQYHIFQGMRSVKQWNFLGSSPKWWWLGSRNHWHHRHRQHRRALLVIIPHWGPNLAHRNPQSSDREIAHRACATNVRKCMVWWPGSPRMEAQKLTFPSWIQLGKVSGYSKYSKRFNKHSEMVTPELRDVEILKHQLSINHWNLTDSWRKGVFPVAASHILGIPCSSLLLRSWV